MLRGTVLIVAKLGSTIWPTLIPSKPTIDKSFGTRIDSLRALRIVANARKSLEAKIAVRLGWSTKKFFRRTVRSSPSSPTSSNAGRGHLVLSSSVLQNPRTAAAQRSEFRKFNAEKTSVSVLVLPQRHPQPSQRRHDPRQTS